MDRKRFYILDVFAREKFTGNQLAVFVNVHDLSNFEMQRIAKEMNFSETTFVLDGEERDDGYDVRIFTPLKEVSFAGHPTLGTAYIINHEFAGGARKTVTLNLKAGKIPVRFELNKNGDELLWMRQNRPIFGKILKREHIAGVLGIEPDEIDARFPVQEVSTGLPFIIVPLVTLKSIKKSKVVTDRLSGLIRDLEAKAILVFCPETEDKNAQIKVRMFADYYGIKEDPATGSANGCLAGYLAKYRYFGENSVNIIVEQGNEVGRPSLLYLKALSRGLEDIDVNVGGRVILVAKCEMV